MRDKEKTKAQLIEEVTALRQRVAELDNAESQRQRAEAALRASARYRKLFENANDIVYTHDLAGQLTAVNKVAAQISGYRRDELLKLNIAQLVAPEHLARVREKMAQKLARKQPTTRYELELVTKDGRRVPLEVNTRLMFENRQPVAIQGIARDISERKRLEAALQESEAQFRLQYKWNPVPTYTWQRQKQDFVLIDYNDAAAAFTRGRIAELLGKKASESYVNEPEILAAFERHFTERTAGKQEMQYRLRSTGEDKYLAVSYAFVPPDLLLVHTEDITERKQTEEALRESEKRYRILFQNANDGLTVLHLTPEGTPSHFTEVNDVLCQRLGYSCDELLQRSPRDILAPELVEKVPTFVAEVLRKGHVLFEAVHMSKDGRRIPVEINAHLFDLNGQPTVLAIARDITERKQAEAELLRLSSAVRMSTDSIVITDLSGQIVDVNDATLRMYGTDDKGDLIGKSAFVLIAPGDRDRALAGMAETLREGFIRSREYQVVVKDGRTVPVEMSVSLMKDADGSPVGFVGISRDITQHKQAEAALQQAKEAAEVANRAKSEFLATISHELRTPLGVILGYTDMLLEGAFGPLTEKQAERIRRVEKNAQELFDLITSVLDLNRLEAGRLPLEVKSVDLSAILAELEVETQGVRDLSGLVFVWRVEPGLPSLSTDAGKLKVVLKNLLSNAIKFTERGSVTIEARKQPGGVEISVTDTGRGIPPEQREKIFEAFHQIAGTEVHGFGGVGLGLHIVRRLLAVLGGSITVESDLGRGSTFRVWMPIHLSCETPSGQVS